MLESFVTEARDKAAALKFMKAALRHGSPKAITTDGLRSCGAALKELGIAKKREVGRWANNRAENRHHPFRRRERAMLRVRRMKTLQQFASVHATFHNRFPRNATSSTADLQPTLSRTGRVASGRGLTKAGVGELAP